MAELDVSEVITDPLFTSPVTLVKTVETYDEYGNPVWGDLMTSDLDAVVTSDMKTIERVPDALRRTGMILVRFMVDNAPENFRGVGYDAVIYRGRRFVVKDCADYSQFGQGFFRMICWPEDSNSAEPLV